MIRIFFFLALVLPYPLVYGQTDNYWQQEVNYRIKITLNDKQHTLSGDLTLEYTNHSPDTLHFIWFHIWPNAYKNDQTALYKQVFKGRDEKLHREAYKGYIDSLDFSVDGQKAKTAAHPEHIDIIKVLLPAPLYPAAKITIQTPFFVKLPYYYSRSGYQGGQYMICQWYPKPAVYDRKGWHPMPYLDMGEFYSEFGNYTVDITLPAGYVVGATGVMQTDSEKESYKETGTKNKKESRPERYFVSDPFTTKTIRFEAENVHDFAWFADKDFIIRYDTMALPSGKQIELYSFHQPSGNKLWVNSIQFIKDAVNKYSDWVGEYPYPVVSAVEGPRNNSSGGMEYPMITLITSPSADLESLDAVIAHEIGHNWFYGILGTNEREHPWMDEGFVTFYEFRYEAEKYRSNTILSRMLTNSVKSLDSDAFLTRIYNALNKYPAEQPVATKTAGFANTGQYGLVVYIKAAIWVFIAEKQMGKEKFEKAVKDYFSEWKFKHPDPEDLKRSFERSYGAPLDDLFELLNHKGNFK